MMKDMHREFSLGGDQNTPIPQDILSRVPSYPFEQPGDHPDLRSTADSNARVVTADVAATRHNNQAQRTPSLTPRLTPELTPTGSPKRRSTAGSPRRRSSIGSTKQYYANENRTSLSTSQSTTAPNSPPAAVSLPTRTPNVDGMEVFLQARNRLSYEQFSALMANIRELNAHRRTREETLRAAEEIFGPENNDLYKSFENLLSRHVSAYFRQ